MAIFEKSSTLRSMFGLHCPKCHEGEMFYTPTFSFKRSFDMKERCDVCNEDFFPEPGYYYGAMFISYIFTSFFCIGFVMFFHWILGWSTMASFALLLVVMTFLFTFIFRFSRVIYLSINTSYDPDAASRGGTKKGQKGTGSLYGGR